jgi:hypothetical protein
MATSEQWVPTYEDPVYFAIANLLLTFVGLALVRETGRRVQPEMIELVDITKTLCSYVMERTPCSMAST